MHYFTKRLRLLREKNNLTLEDLADELGISKSFLWDLEQGRRRVHGKLLCDIALYFQVSSDFLLGLADETKIGEKLEYKLDPETVQILNKSSELSPRGKEQLRRVVEWVYEVDERERKIDKDKS